MPQKVYLDEQGHPVTGTGTFLDDQGNPAPAMNFATVNGKSVPVPTDPDPNTVGTAVRHTAQGTVAAGQLLPFPKSMGGSGWDNPLLPTNIVGSMHAVKQDADKRWAQGDYVGGAAKYLESVIPVAGPMLSHMGDQAQQGKWAALGGDLAGGVLGGKILGNAGPIVEGAADMPGAAVRGVPRMLTKAGNAVTRIGDRAAVSPYLARGATGFVVGGPKAAALAVMMPEVTRALGRGISATGRMLGAPGEAPPVVETPISAGAATVAARQAARAAADADATARRTQSAAAPPWEGPAPTPTPFTGPLQPEPTAPPMGRPMPGQGWTQDVTPEPAPAPVEPPFGGPSSTGSFGRVPTDIPGGPVEWPAPATPPVEPTTTPPGWSEGDAGTGWRTDLAERLAAEDAPVRPTEGQGWSQAVTPEPTVPTEQPWAGPQPTGTAGQVPLTVPEGPVPLTMPAPATPPPTELPPWMRPGGATTFEPAPAPEAPTTPTPSAGWTQTVTPEPAAAGPAGPPWQGPPASGTFGRVSVPIPEGPSPTTWQTQLADRLAPEAAAETPAAATEPAPATEQPPVGATAETAKPPEGSAPASTPESDLMVQLRASLADRLDSLEPLTGPAPDLPAMAKGTKLADLTPELIDQYVNEYGITDSAKKLGVPQSELRARYPKDFKRLNNAARRRVDGRLQTMKTAQEIQDYLDQTNSEPIRSYIKMRLGLK